VVTPSRLALLALAGIVVTALMFRLNALSAYGLSDDEVTKFHAAAAYSRGEFAANAEHPMLMKLAIQASLGVTGAVNRFLPSRHEIPVEAAVRMPNAIVGTATVLVIFGVADAYFGTAAALVAALLLALNPAATSIHRLAKEDTFVVFFFLLAVWLYERAKQVGARDPACAQPWYVGSAAAFGLMLASKYLPHFYGLYALANVVTLRDAGPNSPRKRQFFATMAVAFAVANFAIFLPATWAHMIAYVSGSGMSHHGWPYNGRLWVTDVPVSALGIPPTFYLMLLLTRVPLVTLIGAVIGAAIAVVRRRERGFIFIRVFLVFQLIGFSIMAAKFLRYSLPLLVIVDLTAAVGIVGAIGWLAGWVRPDVRRALVPVAYAGLVGVLFAGQLQASPFFSLHRNALARWLDAEGRRFPEQGYDVGVREVVLRIASHADPGAEIVTDVPAVVEFYLARSGRSDLVVKTFSATGLSGHATEQWVIVQQSHIAFETAELIAMLRMRHTPVVEFAVNGVRILQLFRIASGAL
jgi:hypothetical protein